MRSLSVPFADVVPRRRAGTTGALGTSGPEDQRGSVLVWLPVLLLLATLVAVVVIEFGGHLVAISRAATLADSAALAAVSTDVSARPGAPRTAALRVVTAGGGRLEACNCPPGARRARVRVSVEVPGVLAPRLGAARQSAEAQAVLRGPRDVASGDTP